MPLSGTIEETPHSRTENGRVIDIHAHMVPMTLIQRALAGSIPGVTVEQHGAASFAFVLEGQQTRILPETLIDAGLRNAWMEEQGIDVQVVGTWADLFGYELPGHLAEDWSRHLNETLLEATAHSPHYAAFASLPMQIPERSAELIPQLLSDGFVGVTIATRIGKVELDAPQLASFWQSLSDNEGTVFIHPGYESGESRTANYGMINAVGRPLDTTIATARILGAGIPERYPGARILLAHGGGAIPYILGRLGRNKELHPDVGDPTAGLAKLYFDSVVFDPAALCYLMKKASADSVLLGSDYPFPIGDPSPTEIVAAATCLTPSQISSILGDSADRMLDIRR